MTKATANDNTTKAAALYLLRNGLASVNEVSKLSGRSHQIVRIWGDRYPKARAKRLQLAWNRALERAAK